MSLESGIMNQESEKETVFYLVRHGEAEQNVRHILSSFDNAEQFGLTETGKKQARKIAEELAGKGIDGIYASPMRRTRETAEIIAMATGVEIVFDDRLRETDFGIWSGCLTTDFWNKYPDPTLRLDGNESECLEGFRAMRSRLESFLADISEKHNGKHIVLVSHGDPIEVLRGIVEKLTIEESITGWSPEIGSLTEVFVDDGAEA